MRGFLLFLMLSLQGTAVAAEPRVVTSIVPLQEITASIMSGVAAPQVIIEARASAHHFAFKPSHLRSLQQADLVIWIDNHFERGFHDLPDILRASTRQLELMPALSIAKGDGHLWFSAGRTIEITRAIADSLAQTDPQSQDIYQRNAAKLITALETWRKQSLEHWQGKFPRFITDHDFLGHFARDFGLAPILSVHDNHDGQGGLKHLQDLESMLQRESVSCVLILERQASPMASSLAEKYQLQVISLADYRVDDAERPSIVGRLQQVVSALNSCAQ